jgi:hypothetical protein
VVRPPSGLNSATSSINHDRSPVLLTTEEQRDAWLLGTTAEAAALVRPIAGDDLLMVQEGFEKKDLLGAAGSAAALEPERSFLVYRHEMQPPC